MSRPVVGISAYQERARWGVWDLEAVLVPAAYVDAVADAGGVPVVLPPAAVVGEEAAGLVRRLDALVLAGGADVSPARYGAVPHAETVGLRPERDAAEVALLRAAAARDLPLLGVCRGMQVMAVAAGGTLLQHMPDVVGDARHRPAPGVYGEHGARFAAGSLAARIMGETAPVNSYHHQGVESPGSLVVTGWADDGTPETLEDPSRAFVLGVQWHPEATSDRRVFTALVDAARAGAGT